MIYYMVNVLQTFVQGMGSTGLKALQVRLLDYCVSVLVYQLTCYLLRFRRLKLMTLEVVFIKPF